MRSLIRRRIFALRYDFAYAESSEFISQFRNRVDINFYARKLRIGKVARRIVISDFRNIVKRSRVVDQTRRAENNVSVSAYRDLSVTDAYEFRIVVYLVNITERTEELYVSVFFGSPGWRSRKAQ